MTRIVVWLTIPVLALAVQSRAPDPVRAQPAAMPHVRVTYHLRIVGDVPRGMTFWIAYGPPCANFHVVQLHRGRVPSYRATVVLARSDRCAITYLAGYGRVRTPAGFAPGDPVIVIQSVRPANTAFRSDHVVQWHPPLG
jgi:hypothetical protein